MRSGQPCVGDSSITVNALMSAIRYAGSIDNYMKSMDNQMYGFARAEVVEAVKFCAGRKCAADSTIEFCSFCELFQLHAKTESGRKAVEETPLTQSELDDMKVWEWASRF